MPIFIIQGKMNLLKYLKKDITLGQDRYYILFHGNEDDRRSLREHGYSEIAHEKLDKDEREDFLKEYIDLIGAVGIECNSRVWWGTDIASKNRSTSRLPIILYEFFSIIKAISDTGGNNLLIVNPSWVVVDSLKLYLSKRNLIYEHFTSSFDKWKEIISMWVKTIVSLLYMLLRVNIRKIYFTLKLRKRIKELSRGKTYYVIKTFLYNHSFSDDGYYRDVFFGSLPVFLEQKENILILADVLGNDRLNAERIKQCESYFIFPLEVFLRCKDTLRAAIEIFFARIEIKKSHFFFGIDVSGIVACELIRTCNGISYYQFLHYWITRRLIESVNVHTFLLTYENNPWEKMCVMAVRKYSPETEIIGYQHTIIAQDLASIFVSKGENDIIPIPDRILTVGKIPKEIMERYGSYYNRKIESACALRFEYLCNSSKCEKLKRGHILLALEGLHGTHELVNYVLRELKDNMNYQIRIRTHPVLPLKRFENKLTHNIKDVHNFTMSHNVSIKDDISWADVVMYWGSSVSLEALNMGKPIIRYDMDHVLSHDPLFECEYLKWTIHNNTSLVDMLEGIYSLDNDRFEEEQIKARKYLEDYFYPVEMKSLKSFLSTKQRRMANGFT